MTSGEVVFEDGTKEKFQLGYDDFQRLYRTASYKGQKVKQVIVDNKDGDKGPNTIKFG
jgi:hypothetical protein